MRRPATACSIALVLVLPAPALAQAYQCTLPRWIEPAKPVTPDGPVRRKPVSSYVLAASWSPEFCRFAGGGETMQCSGRNGRFGFVLHGLWPEAARGPPPQWCPTKLRPAPGLIRRHLCMSPVPALLAHEWAKHGSCMVGRPEAYFRVSAILWRSLRWPDADRLSHDKNLTAGDLREAFVRANPAWSARQVGIETSRSGWLRGLRLCYGKDFMPHDCPGASFGPADGAPLKIWRGL